ncbi:hypothetical protein [Halalkalibacter krulwichiae]|uniref:Uncharacterized protein n=1 Tax=Halalkalibacter krulwichiae TaxID=199441 RepID=A0A1X9MD25_9BACI|nr:hypothetical protein [Halalkalibacter krulwichiae]ARK31318.1 hypothetical protein BkAM31D_16460 [Halalkalibacter krulwichiae]
MNGEDIGELRRGLELLKRVYNNQFIVTEHLKLEVAELMTPKWMNELDDEKATISVEFIGGEILLKNY